MDSVLANPAAHHEYAVARHCSFLVRFPARNLRGHYAACAAINQGLAKEAAVEAEKKAAEELAKAKAAEETERKRRDELKKLAENELTLIEAARTHCLPMTKQHKYKEIVDAQSTRIYRPRQIYTGPTERHFVPLDKRKPKA